MNRDRSAHGMGGSDQRSKDQPMRRKRPVHPLHVAMAGLDAFMQRRGQGMGAVPPPAPVAAPPVRPHVPDEGNTNTHVAFINGKPVQLDEGGVPIDGRAGMRPPPSARQSFSRARHDLGQVAPEAVQGVKIKLQNKKQIDPQNRGVSGTANTTTREIGLLADSSVPKDDVRNQYTVAHELGHQNENRLVRDPKRAYQYRFIGRGEAFDKIGSRSPTGLNMQYPGRTATSQTPDNEQYAADFAGALGYRWPDGQQVSGNRKRALQTLGILPTPRKRKRG